MTWTGYFDTATGITVYGKAKPLDATWANGIVAMTENIVGEYSAATFADGVSYSVFKNIDGTPGNEASTDTKLGSLEESAQGSGSDATLANQTTIIANQAAITTAIGDSAYVLPSSVTRTNGTTLKAYVGENVTFPPITPTDVDGSTLDTTAITLETVIETLDKTDVVVIADGSHTKTSTTIQFGSTTAANTSEAVKRWATRRTDNDVVVCHGEYVVEYQPTGDS